MTTNIKVKGMHCEACKALIRMELEDAGYGDKVELISLNSDDEGTISLINVSEVEIKKIKEIINSIESYKTI